MGDFTKFLIKAFIRKGLTALGAVLLTHGILTDSESHGLSDLYLEELTGGLLLAGSSAWTYFYNRYVRDKVTTALSLPGGSSPARLEKAMTAQKEIV